MYRRIIIATGIGSAVISAGYAVAAAMAFSAEVELSSRAGAVCLTLILGLGTISYSTWLVSHASRTAVQLDAPPVLAAAMREHADVIAEATALRIALLVEREVAALADRSHARTVAAFREIITSDLIEEELGAAVNKVFRYGMVAEAAGRADNVASIRRS